MSRQIISEFLFVLGCALSTLTFFRPLEINFTYSDLFIILSILLIIGKNLSLSNIFTNRISLILYKISLSLFFIGFIISIHNSDPILFAKTFSQYLYSLIILPLIFKIKISKSPRILMISSYSLVLFLSTTGILGAIGTFLFTDFFIDLNIITIDGRFSGFAGNPNIYSAYLVMSSPLLFYITNLNSSKFFSSIFLYIGYISGLFLSGSFGGFLGFILSFSTYAGTSRQYKNYIKIILPIVILSILYTSYFDLPEGIERRVISPIQDYFHGRYIQLGSYEERVEVNKEAFNMFAESPFMGIGLDNYINYTKFEYTVHNTLLSVATEGGILSVTGLILIGLIPLINCISNLNNSSTLPLSAAFTVALFSTMQVYPHIYSRSWFIPYFLVIFLMKYQYNNKQ